MRSRYIKNIFILLAIGIYVYIYRSFVFTNYLNVANFVTVCFISTVFILSVLFYGFRNNKRKALESALIKVIFFSVAIILTICCFIGFYKGFLRNAYSTKFSSIVSNSLSYLIIIVVTEMFRYNYLRANSDSSFFKILGSVVICLFDFFIMVGVIDLSSPVSILSLVTLDVFPIIVKNYAMTYVSANYGFRIPIIYRIATELYIFIVPVVPNVGEFIKSCILVITPSLLYLQASSRFSLHVEGIKHIFVSNEFKWYDIPVMIALVVFMVLLSGTFKYSFLGIASNSMSPEFSRGDAVLVSHMDIDELQVGDIIAYKNNNVMIVHRIVEVHYDSRGEKFYRTKGDANNTVDTKNVYFKDIKGKVLFNVKYIAYPTVLLNDSK